MTSAEVERAIMPSSVDLPTPEPAKMPRRWPRPQGTSASIARTPSDDALLDRAGAPSGRGGGSDRGQRELPAGGVAAGVDRAAEAVEHPAEQLVATAHAELRAGGA